MSIYTHTQCFTKIEKQFLKNQRVPFKTREQRSNNKTKTKNCFYFSFFKNRKQGGILNSTKIKSKLISKDYLICVRRRWWW